MEEEEVPHAVSTGTGTVAGFAPGGTFRLGHAARPGDYTLVSVSHSAQEGGDGLAPSYHNSFVCLPAAVRFRPPRVTAKPTIAGAQTAVVVGPGGREEPGDKETFVDDLGRVRVRFCWDRPAGDREGSCWVRVGQVWAGRGWGSFRLPRISEEVVIQFLDGDPDRPIIAGSLYTTRASLPGKPQERATRYTLVKSHSSPGGGRDDGSEISVEDKKGAEQMIFVAQRDLDVRVRHDAHEHVGGGKDLVVSGPARELIEGGRDVHVKHGARSRVEGSHSLRVTEDMLTKVDGLCSIQSGGDLRLEAGGDFIVRAARLILLGPGGSFITIGPDLVLQAPLARLNCGVAAPAPGPVPEPVAPQDPPAVGGQHA
jgi:type VI secretion system secreted protein VgrG